MVEEVGDICYGKYHPGPIFLMPLSVCVPCRRKHDVYPFISEQCVGKRNSSV
jgi:hypothetical protein